ILGTGKGVLKVFSLDFPLLGAPPIPVPCSIILTSDFPLLEAEVALIRPTIGYYTVVFILYSHVISLHNHYYTAPIVDTHASVILSQRLRYAIQLWVLSIH
ncbi:hypothetical protein L208DRAFT_1275892, partial [Tricholoma matsutake]